MFNSQNISLLSNIESLNNTLLLKYIFIRKFILFASLISFIQCNNPVHKNVDNFYKLNIEQEFAKRKDIYLSDIISQIEYIPLETVNSCLLNSIDKIQVTKSFIFISDKEKLIQFDRKGNFLKQIGKTGRGPGEYTSIMHFSANEIANIILLSGEYRFNKYNFSGEFIENVTTHKGIDFIFYNPNRIAFYKSNNVENPVNLVITNQNIIPIYEFKNSNPRPKTHMGLMGAPLFVFNNNLYFKEHYNDTLFCVEDSLLKPHIIYQEKKLLLDKRFVLNTTGNISDLQSQLEKVKDKLICDRILESNRFVFTRKFKEQMRQN